MLTISHNSLLHRFAESLELQRFYASPSHLGLALLPKYQVHIPILPHIHWSILLSLSYGGETFITNRYKRISRFQDSGTMYGRIIERISCNHLSFVVPIAVAETGGIVVHPGNGTAVFLHLANVADVPDIGDPVVLLIQKSGKEGVGGGGGRKVGRGTDTVESVYHQYGTFGIERPSGRKNFGRETFTALVDSGNLVAAHHAGGECGAVTVAVHQYSVVEISVADAGIDNVFLCYGSRFQRIRYGSPGQFHFIFTGHAQGHVVYR